EVPVGRERSVGLDPDDGAGLAGHDQQAPVRQPAEPGGLAGHLDLDPGVARLVGRAHGAGVEVHVPEAAVVPARALAEEEPVEEGAALEGALLGDGLVGHGTPPGPGTAGGARPTRLPGTQARGTGPAAARPPRRPDATGSAPEGQPVRSAPGAAPRARRYRGPWPTGSSRRC